MPRSRCTPVAAVVASALFLGACGSHARPQLPPPPVSRTPPPPPPSAPPPPAPAGDPVADLLRLAAEHVARGEQHLGLGHIDDAQREFDAAIEILLTAPDDLRGDGRVKREFDRLVARISVAEAAAFGAGDGFAEKPAEPASIDELLAATEFLTPTPPPELERRVEADLAETTHDLAITLTPQVLKYVDLFTGKLRGWFGESLQRGSQYMPMIQSVFRAEGLPLDLAYVPIVESAFKPSALSRAKAKGVWQFMQGTARENGLRHDWFVDERADPDKATAAAARYLQTLQGMFDGDWLLALASYNGGPGRIQRAIKRARTDDFWALAKRKRLLPRETREYVPMILAAIIIARNPAEYGFDVTPEERQPSDVVLVPSPVDLRRVAEWTGTSIDEVQALNPELRRWTTPPQDDAYPVKVPPGRGELLRMRLEEATPEELASLQWHTVKRGETLAAVARRYRVSRTDLAQANRLSTRARLASGQQLLIPRAPSLSASSSLAATQRADAASSAEASVRLEPGELTRITYRVRRGDTLSGIARRYQTTVADLKTWNRLRGTRITAGDRLVIYVPADAASELQ